MKMSPREFRDLQAFWYARLRDETDFVDIENELRGNKIIRGPRKDCVERMQAREEYYRLLRQKVSEDGLEWDNRNDRRILELHSLGMTFIKIAADVGYNRISVSRIVVRYVRRWGIVT